VELYFSYYRFQLKKGTHYGGDFTPYKRYIYLVEVGAHFLEGKSMCIFRTVIEIEIGDGSGKQNGQFKGLKSSSGNPNEPFKSLRAPS